MRRLWRMRKQNVSIDAYLRDEGPSGVEISFAYDGTVAYRRRWPARETALAEVAAKRAELEREGWTPHW